MTKRTVIIVLSACAATLFVVAVGLFAYDTTQKDHIAKGVTVGGVDVGGLTKGAAYAKIQAAYLDPLQQPVKIRAAGRTFHLDPKGAKVTVNVNAMVDEAVSRSRSGDPFSRAVRDISGGTISANLTPQVTYSENAVGRLVKRIAARVDRKAVDASATLDVSGPQITEAKDGLQLQQASLRRKLEAALVSPATRHTVKAKTKHTKPKVTTTDIDKTYGTALVVNRSDYTLKLYKNLKLVKTYGVAVGQQGLETPAGLYNIQDKQVDPVWNVPNSAWAGDLAGTSVPGGTPQNPLKARWMGIYNGAGIHGTSDDGSIGSAASHGCIRMHVPDVIDLYDRVPVGAPIYIA